VDSRAGLEDVEKRIFLTLAGLEIQTPSLVQPVASSYTDLDERIILKSVFKNKL
jgi:hypothetical protein